MSHNVGRRDILRGIGVAGTIGVAGCIGSENGGGGGGGGGGGPDLLNVIGYPQSGIQLFRDYYSESDGSEDIIVPDGLRDGSMPGQVGNDMANVTGTAPAAGGPNQQAFNDLYQDQYDESPGVFTSQSYDSVAILILANVAAGENSGPAVKEQMRRIANPDGEEYGPGEFVQAVEAVANGENVNYQGASSSTNFNEAGDPASAAYSIWEFEGADSESINTIETQTFEGENPDGAGPSADESPGGLGREVLVGILLPETGDLASVGGPMINAAELPARQVNNADIDLTVNAQFEDTQTSPDQGISAAESLVSAGVPAVCGSASSGVNVPVSQEVFIPNEVVGCSPSSTALSVTNLDDNDYIFRTAPSDLLQGRVMAQVAAERLEAETAATLYVNNDYGQQLSERFSEVFQDQFDGEVLNQVSFNKNESSYSSVIESALSE
ncbi:ABC transporter substrate-binding protein [Halostella sp. JP-L12]|uniref:ABC transporter substrate-binding protein n=1 Tax=Halostella TaxID=1843185 RepID=UPI000EF782B3|nr:MULTISPECIES: ABC transporter substrate-binding protein [Halostella]NHN48917.1 ABC transporter substrate-binding protein [Halostella sp. JP-L12]